MPSPLRVPALVASGRTTVPLVSASTVVAAAAVRSAVRPAVRPVTSTDTADRGAAA